MNFLKRLFGKKEEPVVELPPEFLQEDPPDWLIDLKGAGLAEGRRFSVRVQLTAATRAGAAEFLVLPRNAGGEPMSASGSLYRTEIDRLFVILGFSFPQDITDVAAGEAAGMPVTITIHKREPHASKTAECDLGGWLEARKPGPPVIEIGRVLLEAQGRILPT